MCDHDSGVPLSFNEFVSLLQRPPFEPCESELDYLTPVEYKEAFTEAMRRYYREIKSYIAHVIDDYDTAYDITQEVFINIYKAHSSFDRAYIYRAAKNAAYSEFRRRNKQRRIQCIL